MNISIRQKEEFAILDIQTPKLDADSVVVLKEILFQLINEDKRKVLINFANVTEVDSLAIGCIMAANQLSLIYGHKIGIFNVITDVLLLFYVVKMDKHVNIYMNEIDALKNKNSLVKRNFKVV